MIDIHTKETRQEYPMLVLSNMEGVWVICLKRKGYMKTKGYLSNICKI